MSVIENYPRLIQAVINWATKEALIRSVEKLPIIATDIKPGFVDTDMAKGEGKFWVATPQKAAEHICSAINKKKQHVYITRRWRLIGWVLQLIPNWLYQRMA